MGDATLVKLGACNVYYDGADMGYTFGGVKLQYNFDTFEKMVDQEDSAVDEVITKHNFEAIVPFAEYQLPKLIKFFPGASLLADDAVSPGKFRIILTSTYGTSLRDLARKLVLKPKGGTANEWVTIHYAMPRINIDFTYEREGTRVYNVIFRALKRGNAFVSLGDTSLTRSTPGVVIVEATDVIPASWYEEPSWTLTCDFTVDDDSIQKNVEAQFTSTATGSPETYYWDFGDGNYSWDKDPKHAYTTAGTYTVSHTVIKDGVRRTKTYLDMMTISD